MTNTWIITGSARGLGRAILSAALEAGQQVLATARDTNALGDMQEKYASRLRLFTLDVTDEDRSATAAHAALEAFGGIDVLINNAGYGHFEAFEQKSPNSFRDEIETNLFGVVNMTRSVLPFMRRQRSGHILNISSVGGRVGTPGLTAYQAAKWAVGGFTEVLRNEVSHLNIKVIALEPGGMRTDWARAAGNASGDNVLSDYHESVGKMTERIRAYAGHEVGDPAKIAQLICELVKRDDLPAHLVLGSDALASFDQAEAARKNEHTRWLQISKSVDFDSP